MEISKELKNIKQIAPELFTDFKLKNLCMAIEALKLCGLKKHLIYKAIKKLRDVNGLCQIRTSKKISKRY